METNKIFENLIKIEPKVVSIETLFNNEETLRNTKYDPDYQRNYVWDIDKATYFIESILLGTEIPPIIYFRNGDKIEIIDGRQRYQTILKFIKDEFKLKISGLHKLSEVIKKPKSFKDIGDLRDVFWDTKLRIIEFSFHTITPGNEEMEDIVKKEIFKRYNSGITPLKPTDIDKAFYLKDELNSYIQKKLADKVLLGEVTELFYFENSNMEVLLKKIRQLLVQHKIPIKYYVVKKDIVISQYYEILSSKINEGNIQDVFSKFIEKINILKRIKKDFTKKKYNFFNRLISECTFWALSVIEEEGFQLKEISSEFILEFVDYIKINESVFNMDRSSFSKEIQNRYTVTSNYFHERLAISFENYIQNNKEFKAKNKNVEEGSPERKETSFDDLRINKPEPSSITIVDICRQMEKQRFLIRPPYQRVEVINKNKSSAIIESILLGIKLPPVFVYKREDGVSEVLDGQQRLLSILGFLKKEYLDENNQRQKSIKHGYSLSLKNGLLTNLDGYNVDRLAPELVKKINNFDLWIIEINHRYNKDFEPIDLFLRLNTKPYPIKENTFEMWNSYINKEIIERIKLISKENEEWLYFRKNNSRMENENIYTALVYFEYSKLTKKPDDLDAFEYYKVGNKVLFRLRSKTEITKALESTTSKDQILIACADLKNTFISKVKSIVSDNDDATVETLNRNLEFIFNASVTGRRTQQSFYALWHFLSGISNNSFQLNKTDIRNDLNALFLSMDKIESKELFEENIINFWKKYKAN
jgi:uncharacterized protein with ParB-like and HNH nuclease domain